MCRHLSICIASVNERTIESVTLAEWLAKRYKASSDTSIERQHLSTLFILIDLFTLFRLFHDKNYEQTIRVAERLQMIPLDPDQIQSFVSSFHMVPDEVFNIL